MHILIADDSEADQLILSSMMKRLGDCQVVSFGSAVLTAIQRNIEANTPFELLCLDIMLPDMGGHEVLQQVRQYEKSRSIPKAERLKILMTTGMHDVKHILKATNLGCDGYLTKPVSKERLMIELSKLGFATNWE